MKKILNNKYVQIVLCIFVVILFYFFMLHISDIFSILGKFFSVLMPLIIGLILAYIMNPIVGFFEKSLFSWIKKKKVRRNLSITITILLIFGIFIAIISVVIPQILTSIKFIIVNAPSYLKSFEEYVYTLINNSNLENRTGDINSYLNDFLNTKALPKVNDAMNSIGTGLLSLGKSILNFVIGLVFSVYILANNRSFKAGSKKILYAFFNVDKVNKFLKELTHINKIFLNFMKGKVCDSSIVAISTFLFLLIFGFPYPLLIAVIIGMTDLIPYFGPYLGTIPSSILIAFVDPIKALIFIIFIIVLQQIDANLITPRIQGKATGLPSFWVLFAITLFGGIFGIVGLLIGVPLFTVIYEVVNTIIDNSLDNKSMPKELDYYESHSNLEKKVIKANVK